MRTSLTLLILVTFLSTINIHPQQLSPDYFQKNIEVYFSFKTSSGDLIRELTNIVSIDNVDGTTVYAYASENEYNQFLSYNLKHSILPKPGELIIPAMSDRLDEITDWNVYPTYEAYVNMMTQYAANYPSICKLIDAGNTVQGRKILLVKISDNVNVREAEPQFLYTSTIHGDETTGYVLMLRLIDSLLTAYGTNPRITNIVNNAEIWINPNANPDGTYHGGNNTVNGATRYNANGYDLNRNFPDPVNGVHPNQQQETAVFRNLAEQNNFVLCANFHGGTEVVNYPWDTWTSGYPDYVSHADDNWYQFISHLYADTCQAYSPSNYMGMMMELQMAVRGM
jgi:murein tripeptide amidase MpaA